MPTRALVVSMPVLAAFLLAVVMLAMLSAESDQSMIRQAPETSTVEMSGSASAEPCEETASQKRVADAPPETAWISRC